MVTHFVRKEVKRERESERAREREGFWAWREEAAELLRNKS